MVVEQAVDPGSAIIINPNPGLRQIKRVLTKAIITELLTFKDKTFYLKTTADEPILLGKDFNEVITKLRYLWPDMVFVESVFNRNLVVDEHSVISCMNKIYENIKPNPTSDLRFLFVDKVSISECLKQAEILLPRLRKYRRKSLPEVIDET
jgi:hypothetical protein